MMTKRKKSWTVMTEWVGPVIVHKLNRATFDVEVLKYMIVNSNQSNIG